MKNKTVALIAIFSFTMPVVAVDEAMKDAIRNGAMARILYRVVDDAGSPVSNATAHVWFNSYGRRQDNADWLVVTDGNGMFTVEHRTNESLDCGFDKEGYYHSSDRILFRDREDVSQKVIDGKWQPYNEMRTVVLNKIHTPIIMRGAPSYVDFKVPVYDHWIGFDFDENHFVAPFGNGKTSDVLLRFTLKTASRSDYHMRMEVSFTNQLFAGAYVMKKNLKSDMASVYSADKNATYIQTFAYQYDKPPVNSNTPKMLGADEYLVFRTRTEVGKDGRLKSARYGKIYGPWHFVGPRGMSIYGVFFNPTLNDLNLEDQHTVDTARKMRRTSLFK